MSTLQEIIEQGFENRAEVDTSNAPQNIREAVAEVLQKLNTGELRVAARLGDSQNWETHQWIKKAVLLSFRLKDNEIMEGGSTKFFDKVD